MMLFPTPVSPIPIQTLGDISAFKIEITAADVSALTNYHTFFVVAAADCKVYWGDGASITLSAGTNTCTHAYAGAGQYLIQIKGAHTRFYHFTGSTSTKVIEAVKLYSGLTLCNYSFGGCNNPKFKMNKFLRIPPLCTATYGMFTGANGGSFEVVDGFTVGTANTAAGEMFYNANLKSLPSSFILTPLMNSLEYVFYNNQSLVLDIGNFFPEWASGKTVYLTNLFYECRKITGIVPGNRLWNNPNVTFASHTGVFRNCTSLTNYASIPADWK